MVIPMPQKENVIDVSALKRGGRTLSQNLIAPAREEVQSEALQNHAADPIKSVDTIFQISRFLISQQRYRDNMLFIVGINFGLRVSDLRTLRFSDLINEHCTFRDRFPVFERKTRNTRKRKKNRYITINDAVIEAVTMYLEHTPGVSMSDYLFRSESNHGASENKPLTNNSIDRILKGIAKDLSLPEKISTHTLRKTFCYHQMLMSHNDPRKLLLLQKMLGHASPAQTLDYIGITSEEIDEAYKRLNLGSLHGSYLVDSVLVESEERFA